MLHDTNKFMQYLFNTLKFTSTKLAEFVFLLLRKPFECCIFFVHGSWSADSKPWSYSGIWCVTNGHKQPLVSSPLHIRVHMSSHGHPIVFREDSHTFRLLWMILFSTAHTAMRLVPNIIDLSRELWLPTLIKAMQYSFEHILLV